MHAIILFAYWLLFWQRFLRNPSLLCTSEIATTYFPFWTWMDRKWRPTDNLYYRYPACIPFLSMWYPPNVISAYIGKFLCKEKAFNLYTWFILGHYFAASLIAYKLLGLFGALTLTYGAYCIKPQTPSFVFTMTWIPGIFLGGWFGAFSLGMAILGGYWPILVYVMPVAVIMAPTSLVGILLGLPQIIPFLWYWPRSVRAGEKIDPSFGRLPWWKLRDLFWPTKNVGLVNGVHYPEAEMFMGIAVLFIFKASWWWIPLCMSVLFSLGFLPPLQRIPARSLYLQTFSISYLLETFQAPLAMFLVQMFLLLRNASIYPSFPFSQWWNKPSKIYPRADYTGYLTETKKNDYQGAFCLRAS